MSENVILKPQPRSSLLSIAPYVPGRASTGKGQTRFKLSANETPFGPSPLAIDAYRACSTHLADYPDGSAGDLREALAGKHGLEASRILCGAGSDEILNLVAQAYLNKGDETLYSEHGFLVYPIATKAAGGKPVAVPEKELTADVDGFLSHVTTRTKIVFLANPNNPTGTYLSGEAVKRLHEGLRSDIVLVLDEAYCEYVDAGDYQSGFELARHADNVLVTRTFSKVFGLAALRLGWAYGSHTMIETLNRIRGPFNVSTPAQKAGLAAIGDEAHLQRAVAHNTQARQSMTKALQEIGLDVTPSVANFVLVHFDPIGPLTAKEADQRLQDNGIVVRAMDAYGFPDALRITLGLDDANAAVIEVLRVAMKGQGA
jgi:histidinol-phosphate aminotransferase